MTIIVVTFSSFERRRLAEDSINSDSFMTDETLVQTILLNQESYWTVGEEITTQIVSVRTDQRSFKKGMF